MKINNIKKHVLTGISFMIPMVVAGGILGALAKGFGGYDIGNAVAAGSTPFTNMNPFEWTGFWWGVNQYSSYAMNLVVGVLTAGICYSISDRPGIVPGFLVGYTCAQSKAGFLGGLLMAFIIGAFVNWMKTWKLPKWASGLMPVLIIPVVSTFVCGMLFLCVFCQPLAWLMNTFQAWIASLNSTSKFLIGAVIGGCLGSDMGGPIGKTASMAANGLGADGINGPMSAKIIGGMTPPLGLGISLLLQPKKFSETEKNAAITAVPMGFAFITEGCLPFAAADPLRFIPCSIIGSALAGGISVAMGVESVAAHGGIFVVPMMVNPWWFIVALVVGSTVTGVLYAIVKTGPADDGAEEEILDLDIDLEI